MPTVSVKSFLLGTPIESDVTLMYLHFRLLIAYEAIKKTFAEVIEHVFVYVFTYKS